MVKKIDEWIYKLIDKYIYIIFIIIVTSLL